MNAKFLLALSILANVAFAAAYMMKGSTPTAPSSPPPATVAPAPKADAVKVSTPAASLPAPAPAVVVRSVTNTAVQKIDWRMVESADYRQYISNLRGIGCPEETIRDIITADVNKLFDSRFKALRPGGTNKFEYWKSGMAMFQQMVDEKQVEQRQTISREKRALLTDLLGFAPEEKPDMTMMMGGVNPFERMLDFLPASKQTQVMEIEQKFAAKVMKSVGDSIGDNDGMKTMMKVQKDKEAELAKLLTPAELDDYNLRMSNTANMLRFQLTGFDPNEQEFRDVFKARKKFDDEFGFVGVRPGEKAEGEKYDAAKKEMTEQLKQALGDARYADYERAQDFVYQGIYRVTEKQQLGRDTANKVFDMKKVAEDQASKIRKDDSLTPDQRQSALSAIRTETETAVSGVLGQQGYDAFKKNLGASSWLKSLSPDPKPTKKP
jgi:hypothetical protein